MNLSTIIEVRAREQPQHCALLAPGGPPLNYAGLWQQVKALGDALATLGATAGTAVATVLPNGADAAISFLGIASGNLRASQSALGADELRFICRIPERASSSWTVLDSPRWGRLKNWVSLSSRSTRDRWVARWLAKVRHGGAHPSLRDGDIALILHTRYDIVPSWCVRTTTWSRRRGISPGASVRTRDRCLNVMPLFHIPVSWRSAGVPRCRVQRRCTRGFREADFVDWVTEFQPTWYSAVPTITRLSLPGQRVPPRLPQHQFASSARPRRRCLPRQCGSWSSVRVRGDRGYGMTEASHQMASNPLPPGVRKPGSVGCLPGQRSPSSRAAKSPSVALA